MKYGLSKRIVFSVFWIIFLLSLIATGTYAWFSTRDEITQITVDVPGAPGNNGVTTSKATGKSDSDQIRLLLGTKSGDDFEAVETVNIKQVNSTEKLIPVSTADLKDFYYNPSAIDGKAKGYKKVENENLFYHGRIYLKVESNRNNPINIYFERTDGALAVNTSGDMLKASRLGISVENNNPAIMTLDNGISASRNENSYIGDQKIENGRVLKNETTSVEDPAVNIDSMTVSENGDIPEKELFVAEPGEIYPVDIFFYLEGCDPDCTNSLFLNEASLYLGFYAIEAGD